MTGQADSQGVRRTAARVSSLLLSAAIPLVLTPPAHAHAGLTTSNPSDGSALAALPTSVVLTFSEDVAGLAHLAITGPTGGDMGSGDATVEGSSVSQPLSKSASQNGTYLVEYRVVSTDGHPVMGEISFELNPDNPRAGTAGAPNALPEGRVVLSPIQRDTTEAHDETSPGLDTGIVATVLAVALAGGAITRRLRRY